MTVARLNEIFTAAKTELVPLIQRVCASPLKEAYAVPEALKGQEAFSVDKQKEMCKKIAEAIGFDFSKVCPSFRSAWTRSMGGEGWCAWM